MKKHQTCMKSDVWHEWDGEQLAIIFCYVTCWSFVFFLKRSTVTVGLLHKKKFILSTKVNKMDKYYFYLNKLFVQVFRKSLFISLSVLYECMDSLNNQNLSSYTLVALYCLDVDDFLFVSYSHPNNFLCLNPQEFNR